MAYRVCCVIGTRPEFLKMAPIISHLDKSEYFDVITIFTAQHRELLDQMLPLFNIQIDFDLNIMTPNQSLPELSVKLLAEITHKLLQVKPDIVLGQGDTTTAFMAALASFYQHIPYAHIEAGLRSYDMNQPFPEELNRQCITKLSTLHFAPTMHAMNNLVKDDIHERNIFVTGNTIIDTLYHFAGNRTNQQNIINHQNSKTLLVTSHRRENFGKNLKEICDALSDLIEIYPDVEVVFPVHPNPHVKNVIFKQLGHIDRVHLIEPMDYQAFVSVLKDCYLVLTDSGGLQEEAPALGKPVLVMRDKTERIEAIECGAALLVGTARKNIVKWASRLLSDPVYYKTMARVRSPYGDGLAAPRIVEHIKKFLYNLCHDQHDISQQQQIVAKQVSSMAIPVCEDE